jgi:hypothetical protein
MEGGWKEGEGGIRKEAIRKEQLGRRVGGRN